MRGESYKLNDKSIDTWIRVDSVYRIDYIHCPLHGLRVVSPWNFLYYKKARIFHEYRNGGFSPALFRKRERGIFYIKFSFYLCCLLKRTISSFFIFPKFISLAEYFIRFSFFPRSLPILTSCLWSCLHYILFEVYAEFIIWFAKEILAVSLRVGY